MTVPEYQLLLFSRHTNDRAGTAFTLTQGFKIRQMRAINRQHIAFL